MANMYMPVWALKKRTVEYGNWSAEQDVYANLWTAGEAAREYVDYAWSIEFAVAGFSRISPPKPKPGWFTKACAILTRDKCCHGLWCYEDCPECRQRNVNALNFALNLKEELHTYYDHDKDAFEEFVSYLKAGDSILCEHHLKYSTANLIRGLEFLLKHEGDADRIQGLNVALHYAHNIRRIDPKHRTLVDEYNAVTKRNDALRDAGIKPTPDDEKRTAQYEDSAIIRHYLVQRPTAGC